VSLQIRYDLEIFSNRQKTRLQAAQAARQISDQFWHFHGYMTEVQPSHLRFWHVCHRYVLGSPKLREDRDVVIGSLLALSEDID